VPEIERAALGTGDRVEGPAVVVEETTAIVVERGWTAAVLADGSLLLERVAAPPAAAIVDAGIDRRPDPATLEILGRRFLSIATRMGEVLRRTAQSTNIRDRLDFSCALFDPSGGLVANAPHVPVHLGAMSESVRAVLSAHPRPAPGDVFATNDPAQGGSHLPDITVVTPVHGEDGKVAFVVASRGHHADIGGRTPGSMPPDSTRIEHEGVLLSALPVVSGGRLLSDELRAALGAGPYPARAPETNVADLEAQIAANRLGAQLLRELTEERGERTVRDYMAFVQDDAAAAVERALAGLPAGEALASDVLDDGTALRLRVTTGGPRLGVDFTGTSAEHPGNLNAPRAVTVAAVLYVLRLLVDRPIPLNGGCLRAVELSIPAPGLLCPGPGRAVAAGNVETSQRVVDLLLAALGLAAASQGTMNNLTFGDGAWGYYETIGGGTGAGRAWRGASAVQSHMTNTRLTDVEILEARFPVRVRELSIRRGSGGTGAFPGGDGMVRELELLAPLDVAVLADRRTAGASGLAGGGAGAPGRTLRNGEPLAGRVSFRGVTGDRLRIETPGGGGYGST
ncbi:MAG: hydantoinase B/oxoprolinase family protein, partial [Deltaproteobacteria bacterium]|nr:hydantoinase B/oxoprolinase family protein [Deltaproteobacteria bacterium]